MSAQHRKGWRLIPYTLVGTDFRVRVPNGAMVQGEPFVRMRIAGWFRFHSDEPQPGEIYDRIPDEQFDPRYHRPER